jgi:predicted nucleotide-binding protein
LPPRRTAPPEPQPANLNVEQMRIGITRLQRRIADLEAFDPQSVQKRWAPEVKALEAAIEETLAGVFGHRTVEYNRYGGATRLDNGPIVAKLGSGFGGSRAGERSENLREVYRYLSEGKQQSILLLQQAVRGLEEEIADRGELSAAPAAAIAAEAAPTLDLSNVFVVHGHDGEPREAVARFLERLGLGAVILHERPNKGRTIITKFREEAAGVGFAVVLMTPDDVGKAEKAADLLARARQNVVFELGFFIGALGPDRVAALVKGDIERPSDFDGVVYISLDDADWPMRLGRELQAAGCQIDWNKLMR